MATKQSMIVGGSGGSSGLLRLTLAMTTPLPLDEFPAAQIVHRLADFSLGVHDDRPVPRDRLAQRPAGDQEEAHALVARLDADLIAGPEHHQRAVADLVAHQHLLAADLRFSQRPERLRGGGEIARTLEDIG